MITTLDAGHRTISPRTADDVMVARASGASGTVLKVHLRSLRGERSLKDAAATIGIRPDELSKIEQGRTRQIRWDTILRLAVAYQCGVGDILSIEAEDDSPVKTGPVGPREAMLAALRADAGHPVPARRLHVEQERTAPQGSTVTVAALADTPARGPVRRRFVAAGSR